MDGQVTQTAIVTGAARGIGAAIAKRLGAEGYKIAAVDLKWNSRTEIYALKNSGAAIETFTVDVADTAAVDETVQQIADQLGAPTILINNAGITRDNLLFKMTEDDWDTVMNVHLRGTFNMSKAAQRYMTEASFGRIVNMSSSSALGNRGQVNYSSAKAGIQGFTRALAIELGKFGITVNAIAPGFIQTDMTAATAERVGISFEDMIARSAKQIPVQRVGQPDDIANAVSFFVKKESSFISGQTIYVAGGPKG